MLVFWDNRTLELLGMEVGEFMISYRFRNFEDDFVWIFTGVYGPTLESKREDV